MVKTAQTGVPGTRDSKQGTVACERVASPAEAMMQASVVAGIMACRERVGPSRSLKVSSTLSCDEQLEEAQREVPCLSRHEPVPQPEGQSASRPECLVTQPCPDCFSRPRASRSSSLGRGVGLVFLLCAPSFSSLFCRFSVLVSRVLS